MVDSLKAFGAVLVVLVLFILAITIGIFLIKYIIIMSIGLSLVIGLLFLISFLMNKIKKLKNK